MTHAMLSPDLLDGITDPRKQRRALRSTLKRILTPTLRVHVFGHDADTGSFVRTTSCPADAKALAATNAIDQAEHISQAAQGRKAQ